MLIKSLDNGHGSKNVICLHLSHSETMCQQQLEHMEDMGIVSKVAQLTPWCTGMVVVPKSGGEIWLCADTTHLNKSV